MDEMTLIYTEPYSIEWGSARISVYVYCPSVNYTYFLGSYSEHPCWKWEYEEKEKLFLAIQNLTDEKHFLEEKKQEEIAITAKAVETNKRAIRNHKKALMNIQKQIAELEKKNIKLQKILDSLQTPMV